MYKEGIQKRYTYSYEQLLSSEIATMSLFLVPSNKALSEMHEVEQAMIRAQTLLQKKMPTDPDKHKERFEFFTRTAMRAPFLALDKSETDKQTWSNKKMSVEDTLEKLLPTNIMTAVKSKMSEVQRIMDGSAKIRDFNSFWYAKESDDKHVAQFCITRIPNWDVCRFEVYFVEIKASFSSTAVFGIASTSNYLEARYCFNAYSVNTSFLLQEMKTNTTPEKVQEEMEAWDKETKIVCPY